MDTPSAEPTALYRYFDADDGLLYIGISRDPDARWTAHLYESKAPWCQLAAARTLEWHPSRDEAARAEIAAIRAERPRFNGSHNYAEAAFDPALWPTVTGKSKAVQLAALMRGEIASGRWAPGERIPSLAALGHAVGLSLSRVSSAVAALKDEGLLTFRAGNGLFVTRPDERPAPTTEAPIEPKTYVKLPHDWCWSQLA